VGSHGGNLTAGMSGTGRDFTRVQELSRERQALESSIASERREADARLNSRQVASLGSRFKSQAVETSEVAVYGLKTREEWVQAQEKAAKRRGLVAEGDGDEEDEKAREKKRRKMAKRKRKEERKQAKEASTLLSFGGDDEPIDAEEELSSERALKTPPGVETIAGAKNEKKKETTGLVKDPTVDTSFLPDRERAERERKALQELRRQWVSEQEKVKDEPLEVPFAMYDGGRATRRRVTVTKGTTIETFLEEVRKALIPEMKNLRNVSADQLMFVKEDMILPLEASFYDIIVTKAQGRSGPLFVFGDKVEIQVVDNVTVADHSHVGRVLERLWFERNRHIFPASCWKPLDMSPITAQLAELIPKADQLTEQDIERLLQEAKDNEAARENSDAHDNSR